MSLNHSPAIVTDGLVLCLDAANQRSYPGTGTTWSDLAGANDGTLTNGPTFDSANKGSIVFDGSNDYVDCGGAESTKLVDSISITGWVKKISNKGYNQQIINAWRHPGNTRVCFILSFWQNDGRLQFFHRNQNAQTDQVFSSASVPNNEWTHITTTSDEQIVRHYINGKPSGTGAQNYQRSVDSSYGEGIHIGELPVGNEFLDGSIGCLFLYNRALSADEVRQNYEATVGRYI